MGGRSGGRVWRHGGFQRHQQLPSGLITGTAAVPNHVCESLRNALLIGVDGDVAFDAREGSKKLAAQISQTLH